MEPVIDGKPTRKHIEQFALTRERNLLSFSELRHYNDTGTWRYRHPLIVHMSERFQLEELYRTAPDKFLKEYSNCAHNVSRYRSFLKNENRKDKRQADRANLKKHQERKTIFENIIQESNEQSQ